MKCPSCHTRAISFYGWGHGLNAFNYQCPACGTPLKARPSTYIYAALILATVIAAIPFIDSLRTRLGFEERTGRLLFACLIIPWILSTSALVWYFGAYSRKT